VPGNAQLRLPLTVSSFAVKLAPSGREMVKLPLTPSAFTRSGTLANASLIVPETDSASTRTNSPAANMLPLTLFRSSVVAVAFSQTMEPLVEPILISSVATSAQRTSPETVERSILSPYTPERSILADTVSTSTSLNLPMSEAGTSIVSVFAGMFASTLNQSKMFSRSSLK